MSNQPTAEPSPSVSRPFHEPTTSASWPLTTPHTTYSKSSRWPIFTILALAIIAIVIAGADWLRPAPTSTTATPNLPKLSFSDQQVAESKIKICDAYNLVHEAVSINTKRQNPVPGDETGKIAVAANARLALYDGGQYLLNHLGNELATPVELTEAVRSFANLLQEYAINVLADASESRQNSFRNNIGDQVLAIDRLCK